MHITNFWDIPVYLYDKATGRPLGADYYHVLANGTKGELHARRRSVVEEEG